MIKKMLEKASVIDKINVKEEDIIFMDSLEDFYNQKGKLYYMESNETFYKKDRDSLFAYKYNPELIKEKPKIISRIINGTEKKELPSFKIEEPIMDGELDNLKEFKEDTIKWANELKTYIDINFNKIKKRVNDLEIKQKEIIGLVKRDIDLKIEKIGENG